MKVSITLDLDPRMYDQFVRICTETDRTGEEEIIRALDFYTTIARLEKEEYTFQITHPGEGDVGLRSTDVAVVYKSKFEELIQQEVRETIRQHEDRRKRR